MSSGVPAVPLRRAATKRPGGRTSDVTERIFAATVALLEEGGIASVTFQRVAEQAGVSRATLYRRWPEPVFLVGDALAATAADRIRIENTGSLRGDLAAMLTQIGVFIESSTGRAAIATSLMGRVQPEFTTQAKLLWERRREDVAPIFARAIKRGELAGDCDTDVLFAATSGALYMRMIVMAKPIDAEWISRTLALVLPSAP
ncbi:TetR/AcrR family transcriptional regulator [Erythrobacter sp.]|uniref:TetR/AcrR family transcriptional regulator n=1 Tax=Erythrobacter sp. TaxID=1042 RepID=UPI0025EAA9E0|nr:TetR/AcrR family transcriptional regulator [Erythrobacter sp.]